MTAPPLSAKRHLTESRSTLSERLADALERHPLWFLACVSLAYFAVTSLLASRKLLWYDELATLYIAQVPDFPQVLSLLAKGVDLNPPFFFLVTRAFVGSFGPDEMIVRLPAMLGFWVMLVALYLFVARRTSPIYGFVAMSFALVTVAYDYAYEARPYGLVLGFSGLALVFWQMAADGRHRRASLVCLFLSLAGAVASHYYAVLVVCAIALGELLRTLNSKRPELSVWGALGAALLPLAANLEQIRSAAEYAADYWAKPRWSSFAETYIWILKPGLLSLAALLCVSALIFTLSGRVRREVALPAVGPLPQDYAVTLGFLMVPVLGVLLGMLFTGAFTPRYMISCVIGFSAAAAFLAYRASRGSRGTGSLLLLVLLGGFLAHNIYGELRNIGRDRARLAGVEGFIEASAGTMPVVLSDPLLHFQLTHHARSPAARRTIYLVDSRRAADLIGQNSAERAMQAYRGFTPLQVADYRSFVSEARPFLIHWHPHPAAWAVAALAADGRQLKVQAQNGGEFLFLVQPPGSATAERRADASLRDSDVALPPTTAPTPALDVTASR